MAQVIINWIHNLYLLCHSGSPATVRKVDLFVGSHDRRDMFSLCKKFKLEPEEQWKCGTGGHLRYNDNGRPVQYLGFKCKWVPFVY
uniref:Uncharacterized protein n=1 Tax=Pyxicephalus adspersus TaxID=30357 RepID=A0AAV3B610_PYXAD|nr:TPA: hypothetical protein GDO54_000649 [Pyxicephalus adspersus]